MKKHRKKRGVFRENLDNLFRLFNLKIALLDTLTFIFLLLTLFLSLLIFKGAYADLQEIAPTLIDIAQKSGDAKLEEAQKVGTDKLLDMKETTQNFMIYLSSSIIIGIFLALAVISFFNSIIWNLIKKTKYSIRLFWRFLWTTYLIFIVSWILLILTTILFNEKAIIIFVLLELFIFFNLFHVLYSLIDLKKGFWKDLKKSFSHIKKNINAYIIGTTTSFLAYIVLAILAGLLTGSIEVLYLIISYILLLLYLTWLRTYLDLLIKGVKK